MSVIFGEKKLRLNLLFKWDVIIMKMFPTLKNKPKVRKKKPIKISIVIASDVFYPSLPSNSPVLSGHCPGILQT